MASSSSASHAVASGDLVDLISSSSSATIYPSDESILNVLNARFRQDSPYTRISTSTLVAVNPYKSLANTNDISAKEYEKKCYKDTTMPSSEPGPLQPHLYELAARIYLLMRRRNQSQSVVFRGVTGSGKSFSSSLLVNQLLRLSTRSKREAKLAEQIKAFGQVLDSFGNAKTVMNANASRHGRYLELHFNNNGRISSAKILTYGLDKTRLNRLSHEERTYHVFYQLLAGASAQERDLWSLEDSSDYALLASSGCYRLPAGPFSDDSIAFSDLRASLKWLGFKPKNVTSMFQLLVAILLLGNLQFGEADAKDVSAYVSNAQTLDQVARLLGVSPEDLSQSLTNKTSYVRKELYTVLLGAEQSAEQRDKFARDLYAILFSYVVESANHRLAPSSDDASLIHTQILLLDQAGFQTRGPTGAASMAFAGSTPFISAYGQNGFDEFCINFADELLHSYVVRNTFEDTVGRDAEMVRDGVSLPAIVTMDNSACVELLRGSQLSERAHRKTNGVIGVMSKASSSFKSGKTSDSKDEELLQDLVAKFGVHASFVASPGVSGSTDRNLFGINHYSGNCSYDVSGFVEKDAGLLDATFVSLLRQSSDPWISKLMSGLGMALERHHKDDSILVQAQVISRPIRQPTPVALPDGTPSSEGEHAELDSGKTYAVTTQFNYTLSQIFANLDRTKHWTVSCIRPNDSGSPNSFDKRRVKAQIRSLLLPDIVARRQAEFVVDMRQSAFCDLYVPTMRGSDSERIRQCARANGWKEGTDYAIGHTMIWLTYSAWKVVEDVIREAERDARKALRGEGLDDGDSALPDDTTEFTHHDAGSIPPPGSYYAESEDNHLLTSSAAALPYPGQNLQVYEDRGPFADRQDPSNYEGWGSEYDKKGSMLGDSPPMEQPTKEVVDMVVKESPNTVEEMPSTRTRRIWLWMVTIFTFWIPDLCLRKVGRMKRPDIRLAWREKISICFLILVLNFSVVFTIVEFGRLLCPNYDKAWNIGQVGQHTGANDRYVAIQGKVYDVTYFIKADHSDIVGQPSNGQTTLDTLGGQDLTGYFPVNPSLACPQLVTQASLTLTKKNFSALIPPAIHASGVLASDPNSALAQPNWYTAVFQPKIQQYYKGALVWSSGALQSQAADPNIAKYWGVWNGGVYDLTDYFNTISTYQGVAMYQFLDTDIAAVFQQRSGQDVSSALQNVFNQKSASVVNNNAVCIKNLFYVGETDFRLSARCQVESYVILVFSAVIAGTMFLKFLAALQLSPKRNPELLDKFVLCQVPCYTESEDSLRRTIDSLSALNYDDKRKLMFIICDGLIIGSGNDKPTSRIVLDILGVDPKLDPEPLLFKSVGEGSRAINYGKVYSGLYEFEGHVVPYVVVVKVGKPTERSKPGNRGKRDSQIMLMHYLNRVHFDAPMSPLELEIYHQMRNVIGIDPAFYEYIFTVDADTSVMPESLNRLVASASDDSSIIGICGETKLQNEDMSWWTMIQVYEYYISHHLSKAFESLFGSVTCLPGCFTLYRIRTADKGRPIIISNRIIEEYAEPNVDTLHKKNLFSLGEDRFLTTLLLKHFPTFRTKFTPDAIAHTMAPESWRVLFSQRRRWINSTIHNLCELVFLPELCGFCMFSMRFFVFIDLLGTLILPATVVYLLYLIITVSTSAAAFPIISIIMIAVVYGLQALVFLIKREFMLVGWMVVYLLSYVVYSFFLPVYSFWCMDDFSWGNTRLVIGEGSSKKVIVNDDEKYDESMIPLKKFSEYEAETWETASRRSDETRTHKTGYIQQPPGLNSRPDTPSRSFHQASNAGDYYRDTNVTYNNSSNPNLRLPPSNSQGSHYGGQQAMSQYAGAPQLPFMPFSGGPGSVAGSDYGGALAMPQIPYQNTGSMYGMIPNAPRNTVMTNLNMFGGEGMGGQFNSANQVPGGLRPMSTFSMATSVNPFAGPSMNPDPTDDDLFVALRNYLSTQDLMTVTKKTAREAIHSHFPKADLSSRKDFLNQSIDKILSES